jgi:hypothetical protein
VVVTTDGFVEIGCVVVGVRVVVVDGVSVEIEPLPSEATQAARVSAKATATNSHGLRRTTHLRVLHPEVYVSASANGQRQDRNHA